MPSFAKRKGMLSASRTRSSARRARRLDRSIVESELCFEDEPIRLCPRVGEREEVEVGVVLGVADTQKVSDRPAEHGAAYDIGRPVLVLDEPRSADQTRHAVGYDPWAKPEAVLDDRGDGKRLRGVARRERIVVAPSLEPLARVVRLVGARSRRPVRDALAEDERQELRFRRDQRRGEELRIAGGLLEALADRDRADVQAQENARVTEKGNIIGGVTYTVVAVWSEGVSNRPVCEREPCDPRADPRDHQRALGREPERRAEDIERVVAERAQSFLPCRRKLFPLVVCVRRLRQRPRLLGGGDGRSGQGRDDQADTEKGPHGPTAYHLRAGRPGAGRRPLGYAVPPCAGTRGSFARHGGGWRRRCSSSRVSRHSPEPWPPIARTCRSRTGAASRSFATPSMTISSDWSRRAWPTASC